MKYSFCFVIKKIIQKQGSLRDKSERIFITEGKKKEKVELICGPWRDTEEEAKADEELFRKDRKAFFRMMGKRDAGK